MTYDNNVLLIYTGGTIGMNRNPQTGALEPFKFEHRINSRRLSTVAICRPGCGLS